MKDFFNIFKSDDFKQKMGTALVMIVTAMGSAIVAWINASAGIAQ